MSSSSKDGAGAGAGSGEVPRCLLVLPRLHIGTSRPVVAGGANVHGVHLGIRNVPRIVVAGGGDVGGGDGGREVPMQLGLHVGTPHPVVAGAANVRGMPLGVRNDPLAVIAGGSDVGGGRDGMALWNGRMVRLDAIGTAISNHPTIIGSAGGGGGGSAGVGGGVVEIRQVWASNLKEEFDMIGDVVDDFCLVSASGIPCFPLGYAGSGRGGGTTAFNYHNLRNNLSTNSLIQIGLTFSDRAGDLPRLGEDGGPCFWQFNFALNESAKLDILAKSGIDIAKHLADGVEPTKFAELLMPSGAVCNDEMTWITDDGAPVLGYLLKILTGRGLPDSSGEFLWLAEKFFSKIYDVKHLERFCGGGGGVVAALSLEHTDLPSGAGAQSWLTLQHYMALAKMLPENAGEEHAGVLFGIGSDY